jgi:hypothetical protein
MLCTFARVQILTDAPRLVLLLLLLTPGGLFASEKTDDEARGIIQRAQQLGLASRPAWLNLLHYRPAAISRHVYSQVDDDAFFLAENGGTDARAELVADIRGFMQTSAQNHAQCRFPARWHWLKQQLDGLDRYDVACPKFEQWFETMDADRLVLVFPTMYLNNPGSMFGHTFLRFDRTGDPELLARALNYAAAYDPDDNSMVYVFNGVFGGYKGVFSTRSYFETVQTYSNLENRDIREYTLAFNVDEIRQLLRHVWEVADIEFDYFFFRENCSYRLLSLLDVARPGANLTTGNAFPLYAIPVDTVRALDRAGLIVERGYRPSPASRLRVDFNRLDAEQGAQVLQLADGELALPEFQRRIDNDQDAVKLLSLAYDLLAFRGEDATPLANEILAARSRLPAAPAPDYPAGVSPEQGHKSARVSMGGGRRDGEGFVELSIRPGFHDLTDSPDGFIDGAEINVLDTRLRWFGASDTLRLEQLRFFSAVSLSPVQRWTTPLSWQLEIALDRTYLDRTQSTLALVTRGGAGIAVRRRSLDVYAMAMLEAGLSDRFERDYTLLAGLQLGAGYDFGGGRLRLFAESDNAVAGFDRDRDSFGGEIQIDLGANAALRFSYRSNRYEMFDDTDWSLRLQCSF